MEPVTTPLSQGALTSEHDKVTKASSSADIAAAIGVLTGLIPLLKELDPRVALALIIVGGVLLAAGLLTKVWLARQYSADRTALKIASIPAPAAVVKLLLMCLLPIGLLGCATDQRVSAARDQAVKYEDTAIQQHMAVHAVEQKSLYDAQASDIAYRTKLNVDSAVATATANPAIKPAQLAADISRSYQEQQILLNQVNANISSLQQQIAGINAYHTAAQQVFAAIDQYDAVPSVTATGVATAAVKALTPVVSKQNTSAAVVPAPATSTTLPAATVALPVPGQ